MLKTSMPRINLVFRLDDYSAISDSAFEDKLLGLMDKYDIPCTFGIVPFVYEDEWDPSTQVEHELTQEKIEKLRPYIDSDLVEVALHGYHHHTQAIRKNGHIPGEFFGMSLEEQDSKIRRGKEFLENGFSTDVTTFIPPWNTYDLATLEALEKNQVICISTGNRFGPVRTEGTIKYLPALCTLIDIRSTVQKVRKIGLDDVVIVVLFHHYEFVEVSPDRDTAVFSFDKLEELFAWIEQQVDIYPYSIGNFVAQDKTLTANRYTLTSRLLRNTDFVPPFINRRIAYPQYYPSVSKAKGLFSWLLVAVIGYYLFLLALPIGLTLIIQHVLPNLSLVLFAYFGIGLFFYATFNIIRKRKVNYRRFSLLILAIGFLLSVFV